jgi:hypothetical protein
MTDWPFTAHPGSRMDATASAAAQETPSEEISAVTGEPVPVVAVAEQPPALGRGYVVVLSDSNPVLPLLPQDPNRRSAIVLAIDSDVYICASRDDAAAAAGGTSGTSAFYLPAGIAVPVQNRAAWYAAATTTAAGSRISVMISLDGEL